MTNDSTYKADIKRLQKELENYLKWGKSLQWHSSMFGELSDNIFEKCQIMLSPTTLKRFFGVVNHEGVPSVSTLDALSRFIGFENWRTFKYSKKRKKIIFLSNTFRKSLYVSIGFLIAITAIILIGNNRPFDTKIVETVTFSSRVLTNSYPNSVVFDFDLKNIRTDSIYIQQYWDATKTIIVDKDQKQATGIYYFPGYFRAKLMIDGQLVKEHDLFLRSNGWMGTIEYKPVPKYFVPIATSDAILSYPKELIEDIENSSEPLSSIFHYINDLGNVSGDDFTLKASIRTTFNEKWAVCQSSNIYIIGTKGAMIIPFSMIGCSSDNFLLLNDVSLSGKKHDLSAFGTNLSSFTDIRVEVKNRLVTIYIEGKEVYQKRYNESMGKIVGTRFKFLGLGEVMSYSLVDKDGKEVVM